MVVNGRMVHCASPAAFGLMLVFAAEVPGLCQDLTAGGRNRRKWNTRMRAVRVVRLKIAPKASLPMHDEDPPYDRDRVLPKPDDGPPSDGKPD